MRIRGFALPLVLIAIAGCAPKQRFVPVGAQNPYIMFDQKTRQSCWSGPAEDASAAASGEFGPNEMTPEMVKDLGLNNGSQDPKTANAAHLPFCKDLK